MGRLAGGIAHDFNSLLTVMIGYSELLHAQELSSEAVECIEKIQQAGEHARSLTSQLLAFSRKQIIQPKIIDLNTLVREHNKMLTRLLGEDINVVTKLRAEFDTILLDPGQLEQVLLNIAVNARDAMPFGDTLTVETANRKCEGEPGVERDGGKPDKCIVLTISDTGVGMNEDTMSRIFEPFFTTKGRDKGTGLGLSTVYGIVKQNNGSIQVRSEPRKGSSFEIVFPVIDSPFTGQPHTGEVAESLSGTETILLAEDDANVRDYKSTIISKHGYSVLTAEHGEAALELHKKLAVGVDLVISDVVMPKMSGPEFVKELLKQQPGVRHLFVSGYTDDAIVHHGVLDEGVVLMQKPFSRRALLKKIREMLD